MRTVRIAVAIGLMAWIVACNGSDDHVRVIPNPTNFAGRWSVVRQTTGSTCVGNTVSAMVTGGFVDIEQTGSSLIVQTLDGCGSYVYGGMGTVNGSTAMIESDYSGDMNPSCHYDEHFTETVALAGSTFSGEMRFTVNNTGCGTTSSPCEYTGTITAIWCAPGTCPYPSYCQ